MRQVIFPVTAYDVTVTLSGHMCCESNNVIVTLMGSMRAYHVTVTLMHYMFCGCISCDNYTDGWCVSWQHIMLQILIWVKCLVAAHHDVTVTLTGDMSCGSISCDSYMDR